MTMLAVQLFLLLLAAFLAGAMLACLLRRVFFVRPEDRPSRPDKSRGAQEPGPDRGETAPRGGTSVPVEMMPASNGEVDRFGRALTGVSNAAASAKAMSEAVSLPIEETVSKTEQLRSENEGSAATAAAPAATVVAETSLDASVDADVEEATVAIVGEGQGERDVSAIPAGAAAAVAAAAAAAAQLTASGEAVAGAAAAPDVGGQDQGNTRGDGVASDAVEPWQPPADLTLIRGIDTGTAGRLNNVGVQQFGDIAAWQTDDVVRINQSLGFSGRVEKENWIEQAQILAQGGTTDYARRRAAGEIAAPDEGRQSSPISSAAQPDLSTASVDTSIADKNAAPQPRQAATPLVSSTKSATSDIVGLRSIRSEALRGDTAGSASRSAFQDRDRAADDDLKRISGVGVLIEKKLNSLGIRSYEQIAHWTTSDVQRISDTLDFKGRIERESWIEQARILTSGGLTEFSRRRQR